MKFKVRITYQAIEGYRKVRTVVVTADTVSKAHKKAQELITDLTEVVYTSSRVVG